MKLCSFITDQEYEYACQQPIIITGVTENTQYGYLKEMVRKEITKILGKESLYTQGLKITLSINQSMQNEAELIFYKHFFTLKNNIDPLIDGGLICINNHTGEIKALIGGYDFAYSQFNRAINAYIQIGSTIKPLLYAQGLIMGIPLNHIEIDEPLKKNIGGKLWNPSNYDKKYRGSMTLAYALSHSNNIVTIKLLEMITPNNFIPLIKKSGLASDVQPYLSLALGCTEAPLVKIAQMFMIFSNNGQQHDISLVQSIKNNNNEYIWIKKNTKPKMIIPSNIASQIQFVLQHTLEKVYHKKIKISAFAKTGTTNDNRTCLFVGSTPSWTTALYCARDDNQPLGKNIFPSKTVIPIWVEFNQAIEQPETQFTYSPLLTRKIIDGKTGEKTDKNNKEAIELLVEH